MPKSDYDRAREAKIEKRFSRYTEGLAPERSHLSKGEVGDLRRDIYAAFRKLAEDPDFDMLTRSNYPKVFGTLKQVNARLKKTETHNRVSEAVLSGSALLKLSKAAFTITAAELNAAAAGTCKRRFSLKVMTVQGELVYFLNGMAPTLAAVEVVVDADVGDLVVTGTPAFSHGSVLIEVTFPTDAGSTMTYAAGDTQAIECDLTLAGTVLSQVTATWTVV